MKFPKKYKAKEAEKRIQEFWKKKGIYKFKPNSKKPCFSIDTPPPYVSSAHLHVGHAMSYSQAEFIVRYKRMKGFNIFYPMGFDDNGLPTERYVEKKFAIDKSTIPRKDFIKLCLEETKQGAKTYQNLWERLGISIDSDLGYSTIDSRSQRTAQKSFIELAQKGLIIRKKEPILWCCSCQTSISQADIESTFIETKLWDIIFQGPDNQNLLISTTRPELLAACVSLYAHPDDTRYSGIIGKKAQVPLFHHEVEIRTHEDVDPQYGSGLMMVCTWGDMEDVIKWKCDTLPTRQIIDSHGKLMKTAGEFAGLSIKEAREKILKALEKNQYLKGEKKLTHQVGVHERCSTPIEFHLAPQWFIKILEHKEHFLRRGNELKWYPLFMKTRYEDWISGLKWDWCISRQRHYGVPFPLWYCKKCSKTLFPKIENLPVDPMQEMPPEGTTCSCGCFDFAGETDVMDTWMTSSTTPLINAKWAYNENLMEEIYPQSVRVQAFEIIRTWLFYTIVKSHFHTNTLPWESVMISGWGLDEHGKKISKRFQNFIDPLEVIEKYSADSLRYWAASSSLGHDLRYNEQQVADGQRLLIKLWNAARFIAGLQDKIKGITQAPTTVDTWILSKYHETINKAETYFEKFDYSHALKAAEHFFFSYFCDIYMEIIKPRFWKEYTYYDETKMAAIENLNHIFLGILRLFAPFIPYITEEIYQLLFYKNNDPESIHIHSWPERKEKKFENIQTIGYLLHLLSQIRKWKTQQQLHSNASIETITITCSQKLSEAIQHIEDDLKAGARAKSIEFDLQEEIDSIDKIKLKLT